MKVMAQHDELALKHATVLPNLDQDPLVKTRMRAGPSFARLKPASARSSDAARSSSRKKGTRCELTLRQALRRHDLRYTVHCASLTGRPDLVLRSQRIAIFCDGDFWHGRNLKSRIARLSKGHNAEYWTAKIKRNVERDRRNTRRLSSEGWTVLRFWETDILRDTERVVRAVIRAVECAERRPIH